MGHLGQSCLVEGLLAATTISVAACAPPAVSASPSTLAPTATTPSAQPLVHFFRPPAAICSETVPDVPAPAAIEADNAPLTVRKRGRGLSLESSGARAGRVLAELAAASGRTVRVDGFGANVRIYAHIASSPWGTISASVAAAARLVKYEDKSESHREDRLAIETFLDPAKADFLRYQWALSGLMAAPIETRLIPLTHAVELGGPLAELLVECRGSMTAIDGEPWLMVSGTHNNLNNIEDVARLLDEGDDHVKIARDLEKRRPWGRAGRPSSEPHCDRVSPLPPPLLRDGAKMASGAAAGEVMRIVARAQGKDVVVGCGGDRGVYMSSIAKPKLADLAQVLDLRPLDDVTFASAARTHVVRTNMPSPTARVGDPHICTKAPSPTACVEAQQLVLRAIPTRLGPQLASVITDTLAGSGAAAAYAHGGVLLVVASAAGQRTAAEVVEFWEADPARGQVPAIPRAPRSAPNR